MNETYSEIFIHNLLEIAEDRNIPLKLIEQTAGMSRGYLTRFKHKKMSRGIQLECACELARVMGMRLDDILHYNDGELLRSRIEKKINELNRQLEEMER